MQRSRRMEVVGKRRMRRRGLGLAAISDFNSDFMLTFKLACIEYNYNAICGENAKKYVDRVRSAIVGLFVEYGGELNPSFGYACGSDVEESNFTGANKESDDYIIFQTTKTCWNHIELHFEDHGVTQMLMDADLSDSAVATAY
ncbi:hypothetical protein ACH5RR_037057 [Cinchona calisaya]|uniref:Uncharacterized protein n=1 Tax=Cinchona calisaya TaxID=153742 RepID=A0ABD2YAI1_9GENT